MKNLQMFSLKLASGEHVTAYGANAIDAINRYLAEHPGSAPVVGWVDYASKDAFCLPDD